MKALKILIMALLGGALVLSMAGAIAATETNELQITTIAGDGHLKLTTLPGNAVNGSAIPLAESAITLEVVSNPAKTIMYPMGSVVNGSAIPLAGSAITLEVVSNPAKTIVYTTGSVVNGSAIPLAESAITLEVASNPAETIVYTMGSAVTSEKRAVA